MPLSSALRASDRGGITHLRAEGKAVKVIVLKVRHKENLDELAEVIRRGRTLDGADGGWQMPKHAELGDLAVWYRS